MLRRIQNFVKRNERIPLKKELGSAYQLARKGFGTWNDAIRAAGFDPNPVMFANKHMAKDGHKCDSLAERIVDDWLYSKGINHQINVCYPGQKKLTADFVVGNVWIEYFGLAGQLITYDVCMKKKFGLSKKLGFKLVQVFPYHIFPKNTLDQQLCMLLTSLSPATIFIAALGRFNVNSVFSGLGHTPSS
ncbi:hypothetical protein HYW61_00820 [candidate division WWE3 bacterium]|nr:hypothetical protein [candidate division WWE3 bacterium]